MEKANGQKAFQRNRGNSMPLFCDLGWAMRMMTMKKKLRIAIKAMGSFSLKELVSLCRLVIELSFR